MQLRTPIISLTVAAALSVAACSGASGAAAPEASAETEGPTTTSTAVAAAGDTQQAAAAALVLADGSLTAEEAEGLLFMREEEKLARDVYLAIADLWDVPVFDNIAASEQRHSDAVLRLIEAYGLDDPVTDDTPGVFTNPDFAALYDELIATGSASLVDALTVGAAIEDLDISDLRSWLDRTDDPAIERVYANLLAGSENHLRAFIGRLEAQGTTYEPGYLTDDEVDEILAADATRGGTRYRGGRNR